MSKETVGFDLDAFESESLPEPFPVTVGGKKFYLLDARDLDYRELLDAQRKAAEGTPDAAIRALVPEGDRDEFFAHKWSGRALEAMFTKYNEHYGLPTPGEASASTAS